MLCRTSQVSPLKGSEHWQLITGNYNCILTMSVLLAEVVNLGYWVVCSSPSVPSYPHELTTKKSIGVTRGMTNNLEVNCPVKVKGRSHPFPFPALTASIYCFFYQITIVCAIKISYIKTCISWMCFDDKNLSSLNLMSDQYISYIYQLFLFFFFPCG